MNGAFSYVNRDSNEIEIFRLRVVSFRQVLATTVSGTSLVLTCGDDVVW